MANLKILITGDVNDADYYTSETSITQEQLELIKPIIEAVKSCTERPNWNNYWVGKPLHVLYPQFFTEFEDFDPEYESDFESSDAFDLFEDLVPNGVHSIISIEIIDGESTKLL